MRKVAHRAAIWMSVLTLALTGCGTGGAAGGSDDGEVVIRMATFIGEGSAYGQTLSWWASEIESRSGGRIVVDEYFDGTLVPATEMVQGTADGRTDVGHITGAYYPGQFPLSYGVVEIPFVTSNMPASMAALNELYRTNEQVRAEYESKGLHLLSITGAPAGIVGSAQPITQLEGFQGVDVRAVGGAGAALRAAGANPVALPVNEIYQSVERGVISAYAGMILDQMVAFGLHEVGPNVTVPGLGLYSNLALVMNRGFWDGLPDDLRAIVEEVNAETPAQLTEQYRIAGQAACDTLLETAGSSMNVLPEADIASWQELIGDAPTTEWRASASEAGVQDPDSYLRDYLSAVERFEAEFADYETAVSVCAARFLAR